VVALAVSLVVLSIAWMLGALALMRAGAVRATGTYDAIVVLGCRVMPNGTPGAAFRRRIELGCGLLRAGHAPRLVITGGPVRSATSEAESARAFIAAHALAPLDAVVLESEARTTRDNARRTRRLLGDARVLIVSCSWHLPRARRVFARAFTNVECAGAPGSLRGALREVPAWIVSVARGA
jgi:uncharacterized SAM-binding protein YcdF (DUF218 family)